MSLFFNELNNALAYLYSLAATTLSTALVRLMVVGLSGRKRLHWVSNCYRVPDEPGWLTPNFRCDILAPCHWEYAIFFIPRLASISSTILNLGFEKNSTLIDIFTLNQGRQSALTTNVSVDLRKKERSLITYLKIYSVPLPNAKRRRYVTCEAVPHHLQQVVLQALGVFKCNLFFIFMDVWVSRTMRTKFYRTQSSKDNL